MSEFVWREREGLRWLELELPSAKAAFTTRLGGISEPPFDSLNLGIATGDEVAAVAANRTRMAAALELDAELIGFSRQVHGNALLPVAESNGRWTAPARGAKEEADGQIVRANGEVGLVLVADCVPIVIAGPGGVAVLHGGWRGLVADIVAAGVAAVGGSAAAVGPSIGPCCYEVGSDVLERFRNRGLDHIEAGRRLDLWAGAEALLREAGVRSVARADLCTRCNPELLFSHRGAGPRTGRQAGLGWIEEDRNGG